MKYIILLGDGMGDYPLAVLSGKTPLEAAHTPHMDFIAGRGCVGLLESIPTGMPPGSDVAALSILGYDPTQSYPGRGPLEAASMGISLDADDVAFRCNLVTISGNVAPVMEDFSAGHITSAEARELIATLAEHFKDSEFEFYPGVGYRHLCVWRNGVSAMLTTPPLDIISRQVAQYLPQGKAAQTIRDIMSKSQELLKNHRINKARQQAGKKIASDIWLWGQGKAPRITPLTERYSLTGGVISAVDLLNGAGTYAGLKVIQVAGATGYIDTNYIGKAQAALSALQAGMDFVLIHVEAPDEMGHEGNWEGKIKAIEDFDKLVVGTMLDGLGLNGIDVIGDFRLLVLSDHLTPIALRTHTSDPTLFAALSSRPEENRGGALPFSEQAATESGLFIAPGHLLMERFIHGEITA